MRYFEENGDIYNDQIRKIERTDLVEADFVNSIIQELINNNAFVKNLSQDIAEKLCQHIEDSDRLVPVPVQEAFDTYYAQLTAYSDKAIADLINGAPTTLDTLKELADAIQENQSVQEALDAAIGTKANQKEFDSHVATVASATVTGHVKVDTALSSTSTNPVQNKVVNTSLGNKVDKTGDASDVTITFSQASSRTNIANKEKLSTIFGKIMKYFADLGTAAFRSVANDLTTSRSGSSVLDAYQGKVLKDRIDTLNLNFEDVTNEINWGSCINYCAYRIGNVVFLTFMCTVKAATSIGIVNLPSDLTPAKQTTLNSALVAGADINKKAWCLVHAGDTRIQLNVYSNGISTAPEGNTLVSGFFIV